MTVWERWQKEMKILFHLWFKFVLNPHNFSFYRFRCFHCRHFYAKLMEQNSFKTWSMLKYEKLQSFTEVLPDIFLSYHASFTQWLTILLGILWLLQALHAGNDDCRHFEILIFLNDSIFFKDLFEMRWRSEQIFFHEDFRLSLILNCLELLFGQCLLNGSKSRNDDCQILLVHYSRRHCLTNRVLWTQTWMKNIVPSNWTAFKGIEALMQKL